MFGFNSGIVALFFKNAIFCLRNGSKRQHIVVKHRLWRRSPKLHILEKKELLSKHLHENRVGVLRDLLNLIHLLMLLLMLLLWLLVLHLEENLIELLEHIHVFLLLSNIVTVYFISYLMLLILHFTFFLTHCLHHLWRKHFLYGWVNCKQVLGLWRLQSVVKWWQIILSPQWGFRLRFCIWKKNWKVFLLFKLVVIQVIVEVFLVFIELLHHLGEI